MAIVKTNDVVEGWSGKFGNSLVFRTIGNKTYVSPAARKPNKQKESLAQRSTRVTFRRAAEWAQLELLNPQQKTYYQKRAKAMKLPNAYTAALTDYMRSPRLTKVSSNAKVTTYRVDKKDFAVKQVEIVVQDEHGDSRETRILTDQGRFYMFKLTQQERQMGVRINVTSVERRIKSWMISEGKITNDE